MHGSKSLETLVGGYPWAPRDALVINSPVSPLQPRWFLLLAWQIIFGDINLFCSLISFSFQQVTWALGVFEGPKLSEINGSFCLIKA